MKNTTKTHIYTTMYFFFGFIGFAYFINGCGSNHRKIKGELLHKQGTKGIFCTHDDKGDFWYYYIWDSGNSGGYTSELRTLPPGGTWIKGNAPPQEEIEEEETEEATVDTEEGGPEVGEADSGGDPDVGSDAGDGGGDVGGNE
jgi:hypothetical protein